MMRATLLLTLLFAVPIAGQAPQRFAPSGRATSQVSLMNPPQGSPPQVIRVDYGQPHLRGRAINSDSLVPYGQVWRTGANATTTLHTDFDLMFGNVHVAKGSYALFTLPSPGGWLLILQRDEGQMADEYDSAGDIARIPLSHRALAESIESLTISLVPAMSGLRGELRISWGTSELTAVWSAM
ncbi:MAG TPA: DUF2911 domain-containing protein [Gemmatimonadales bacterium]|nr:DUF2911 domain-containing protein [Gemmatimonadales bacterium]